ncbi:MAG: hypothetical protein A3B86_04755 [Candidatus Yanofskybacteria bacterium RIFCSPHIGHO2_02_FULL_38_22b]|uniref:VWFA domain-containing protein n=1 Tax=Candidatus Yanofskybacteria bacterium RIFCSPHIGHO2_02_FULL_38_22b TaxID=1802673 RepID=A0A1F8F318_9BACT|nr:MAG: hypothetical protein A2816_01230 [Candidatus Yanofskybacteria bacterium RIFCSPHIGHO2_01_FULL_39_44]OGN07523.1 MAG: hypothetical protein A3B86_04755 [Candidatus Yanofskybacteria bacterium RIFCSPHIGHO2_02_FULL_38_22b]
MNRLFFSSLCLTVLFIGCGPAPVSQQEARQNIAVAINQDRIQIPLDDKVAGATASLTRNFYFVFDGSGSMGYSLSGSCVGDQRFSTRLDGAKWAGKEFVTKVPSDVNLGLYVFDGYGEREVLSLGSGNQAKFLREVDNIRAGGGTPLGSAVRLGTEKLVEQYKRQLGYGEYRLVVVTDGQADNEIEAANAYLNSIRFNIPIYAIGLCIENNHPLRQYALSYRAADSAEDLRRGLEETLAELPNFDVQEFQPVATGTAK